MFRDFEKSRKKKLPSRVFKGVPQSVRREFWNQTLKVDRFQQPYLTQELSYNLFYRNGQRFLNLKDFVSATLKRFIISKLISVTLLLYVRSTSMLLVLGEVTLDFARVMAVGKNIFSEF